jgi:hypothetical protein
MIAEEHSNDYAHARPRGHGFGGLRRAYGLDPEQATELMISRMLQYASPLE